MFFHVVGSLRNVKKNNAYLIHDDWDDAFKFETSYTLHYIDAKGNAFEIGPLKIGEFAMKPGQRVPDVPNEFDWLTPKFFSVGQSGEYYDALIRLPKRIQRKILRGLRDFTVNDRLLERALNEPVTRLSLLRFVTQLTVRNQFKRILAGGKSLTSYHFKFKNAKEKSTRSVSLEFEVSPGSNPPTNVHVIIGANGVGKTRLLNNMASSVLVKRSDQYGNFKIIEPVENKETFANLVYVTFSAFDQASPITNSMPGNATNVLYSYVGLRQSNGESQFGSAPKDLGMLTDEFVASVRECLSPLRFPRWRDALKMLETDLMLKDSEIGDLLQRRKKSEIEQWAVKNFKPLSSGHKIVLLSITKLVEKVEERTLVLLDEPEVHLHPPLLSAFIRALSELVINRNGVAIIATHSPVVLQEVPKSCVWRLRKIGNQATAERLEVQTFGENVGLLTHEVFGLEVRQAGFHSLLQQAVEQNDSLEGALKSFNNELGREAKAILRTMFYLKENRKKR